MDVFIYPAHTEVTLENYPLTGTQFPPQVVIYPVNRFRELLPDVLPPRVSDLEGLISGGAWPGRELPFLPPLPMRQTFFSHKTILPFRDGQGVRFITEYGEGPQAISNRSLLYTFHGLTEDGMYWVAITLPINNPILPADADMVTPPAGYTEEGWLQNYNSYVGEVKERLDAQGPGSFFPPIDILDRLVGSVTVNP